MPEYKLNIVVTGKDNASASLNQVGGSLRRIGEIAAGIGVAKAIGGMINSMRSLGAEAVTAYANYERLGMALESMVAREMVSTGQAGSMAEALGQSGERAQELLGWIEQLAIKSPFDQQQVADAFRTTLAYGFASDEAQRLNQALIDFTAGTGGSGASMGRIALALGQIRAKGKLAGQEMLQLTEAGVNVREIMTEALGITTEEFVRLQEAGLVPAGEAIEAIISTLERDFSGAAARQAESWAGLLNSLTDLKSITLREFFSGTAQAVQPYVSQLVNLLGDPKIRESIKRVGTNIGDSIGKVLLRFSDILTSLANKDLQGLFDSIGLGPQTAAIITQIVAAMGPFVQMFTTLAGFTGGVLSGIADAINGVVSAVFGAGDGFGAGFTNFLVDVETWGTKAAAGLKTFLGNVELLQQIFVAGQEGDLASAISASMSLPEDWQTIADNVYKFSTKIRDGLTLLSGASAIIASVAQGDTLGALTTWAELPENLQDTGSRVLTFSLQVAGAMAILNATSQTALQAAKTEFEEFTEVAKSFADVAIPQLQTDISLAVTESDNLVTAVQGIGTALKDAFATQEWTDIETHAGDFVTRIADTVSGKLAAPSEEDLASIRTAAETWLQNASGKFAEAINAETVGVFFADLQASLDSVTGISDSAGKFSEWIVGITDSMAAFDSTKWDAFSAGIAGMGGVLISLLTMAQDFAANIDAAAIGSAMTGYVAKMTGGLATAVANAPIFTILTTMQDFLITVMSQLATALGNTENFTRIGEAAGTIVTTLVGEIVSSISDPVKRQELFDAVSSLTESFITAADAAMLGFAVALANYNWGNAAVEIGTIAAKIMGAIVDGMVQAGVPPEGSNRLKETFSPTGPNWYTVLSDAYIEGLMGAARSGEKAANELKNSDFTLEKFFQNSWKNLEKFFFPTAGAAAPGMDEYKNAIQQSSVSVALFTGNVNSFDQAMATAGANTATAVAAMDAFGISAEETAANTQALIDQLATGPGEGLKPSYEIEVEIPPFKAPEIKAPEVALEVEPPKWERFIKPLRWPDIASIQWDNFIRPLKWPPVPFLEWSQFIRTLQWPSISPPNWSQYIPRLRWPEIPPPSWDRYIPKLVWTGTAAPGSAGSGNLIGGNASGSRSWRGGLTLVGERGPEFVRVPRGSQIYSNYDSRMMAAGAGGVSVAVGPVYISNDQDVDELAWRIAKRIDARRRR